MKKLSSLKGHRYRHRARFDKNLQYSDIKRTEQMKIVLLEQNDEVISPLDMMGDSNQYKNLQAAVFNELAEATAIGEDVNEAFVVYCQRIQENLAQGNQRSGNINGEEIETSPDEMPINARQKAHLRNAYKKPAKME